MPSQELPLLSEAARRMTELPCRSHHCRVSPATGTMGCTSAVTMSPGQGRSEAGMCQEEIRGST